MKCGNSVLKNIQRATVNPHPPHSTLFCYLAGVCGDGDSIGGVATSVKCKYYCVHYCLNLQLTGLKIIEHMRFSNCSHVWILFHCKHFFFILCTLFVIWQRYVALLNVNVVHTAHACGLLLCVCVCTRVVYVFVYICVCVCVPLFK